MTNRRAPLSPNPMHAAAESYGAERLHTPADLARRWGVSLGHLANLRCAGKGPVFIKLGSSVRYRFADVLAYEDAGAVEPITGDPQRVGRAA